MEQVLNYINGGLLPPCSGEYFVNPEPATGRPLSQVPDSDARDVSNAVDAAQRAFGAWGTTPVEQRSAFLTKIADLIERDLEELASIESDDNGKTVALARRLDIPRAVANFRFFASSVIAFQSEAHPMEGKALNYTLRKPIGIVGAISPWNLPLYLFTWKIAPALAAGNCVVAKPSELTPMTAYRLSVICGEAGLPPGVLNIVHGYGQKVGRAISEHPRIPAITFTGGTKTGKDIAERAAPLFKKLSLEMGGKNPVVIFADAGSDLYDEMLRTTVSSSFLNQGEICLCGSRILVERPLYERFAGDFVRSAKALRIGDPRSSDTEVGAINSEAHLAKIASYVDIARKEGGTVLCGGNRASVPGRCSGGWFFEPTVVTGLPQECRTNQEEIFGPVVTVAPFDDEDDAVRMANGTEYGLASVIWTSNLRRAHRVADRLETGIVWVNCWLLRDLRTPFGGMKHSGLGREGGFEALRFYTEPKNVCVKIE
jgi:aminomuconate-semialdehyde/2-hydroxymuconate-6-semialdehyde dehydrogenase